jgi:hypothetical protein
VLGHAAADDAGTHDHDPGTILHTLPPKPPPYTGSHTDICEVCCAWRIPFLYTAQVTQDRARVKKSSGREYRLVCRVVPPALWRVFC